MVRGGRVGVVEGDGESVDDTVSGKRGEVGRAVEMLGGERLFNLDASVEKFLEVV